MTSQEFQEFLLTFKELLIDNANQLWIIAFEFVGSLFVFSIISWLIYQSCRHSLDLKTRVYKSKYTLVTKKHLDRLISLYASHGLWILALILAELDWYVETIYFNPDIVKIMFWALVIYRITELLSIAGVKEMYASIGRFPNQQAINELVRHARRRAASVSWLFTLNASWAQFIDWPAMHLAVLLLIIAIAWLSIIRTTEQHSETLQSFIARQLPKVNREQLAKASKWGRVWQNHFLFPAAHLIHFFFRVHNFALNSKTYKTLATRVLWLRLEQKHHETDPDAEMDVGYEKWFAPDFSPPEPVSQKNQEQLSETFFKTFDRWLNNKTLENSVLLTGKRGSGRSSLLKNWIAEIEKISLALQEQQSTASSGDEQPVEGNDSEKKPAIETGQASEETSENKEAESLIKTCYIKIPEKTVRDGKFFELLADELGANFKNLDELHSWAQDRQKTVIVIDNSHNLFLSAIGGFENYKALLNCVSAGLDNIYWIVAIDTVPAIYLQDVFTERHHFYLSLEVESWSAEDIRELIMQRHKLSKRRLVFDELLYSSFGNDELSSNTASEERCFTLLWEQSMGNPALALAIWAQTAQKKERFTMEIGLTERPSTTLLSDFAVDHLFVYASLAKHIKLLPHEASEATRLAIGEVQQALKVGKDKGFLKQDEQGRYELHPLWALGIIQYLKGKNYLHGK